MTDLERLHFLIHPACWSLHGHEGRVTDAFLQAQGVTPANWYAALHWEQDVIQRHMEHINGMPGDEGLVVYPIGNSAAMTRLLDHAQRVLGPRCLVLKAPVQAAPSALAGMPEPIRRFLEDAAMSGRDEFWARVPARFRARVEADIRRACAVHGYGWSPLALKVIQGNAAYAAEIADELTRRDLRVDPARVRAQAFGEGFEQCAMTWKAMVGHYLGWRHPIENEFALSVSGFPVLFDAVFRERVALADHTRLFLWEKSRRRPLALLAKAQALLTDPRQWLELPLRAACWEVWAGAELVWPGVATRLRAANGALRVPVYAAIRQHDDDAPYYIMAPDLEFTAFREILTAAPLISDEPTQPHADRAQP